MLLKKKLFLASFAFVALTNLVQAQSSYPVISSATIIGDSSLNPQSIISYNNLAYFSGYSADTGRELWRSDGTEAGTYRVKDLLSGPQSSSPSHLKNFEDKFVFLANNSLWISDGSTSGTTLVSNFTSNISELIISGSFIYLLGANKVYISDGTNEGTTFVGTVTAGKDMISDGTNGIYLKGERSCDLFTCRTPFRVSPGNWPFAFNPTVTPLYYQYPSFDCLLPDFLSNSVGNLTFYCPLGIATGLYMANSSNVVSQITSATELRTLLNNASWNGTTYDFISNKVMKVAGYHFGFGLSQYYLYEISNSNGAMSILHTIPTDSCGTALPISYRNIDGEIYYLSRAASCGTNLGGGVYKISKINGSFEYITDIAIGGGNAGKFKDYFNSMINGPKISSVRAGNNIYFNNSGSLEVTSLTTDQCPESTIKTSPGTCGCERADEDLDQDSIIDCLAPPTPTATMTATVTPTATSTPTSTSTATLTFTPTSTATFTATATHTSTATNTATATATHTSTFTSTSTAVAPAPTSTSTHTAVPTIPPVNTSAPTAIPTSDTRFADLVALSVNSPAKLAVGKFSKFTFTVQNTGTLTSNKYSLVLYLSKTKSFIADNKLVIGRFADSELRAGESRKITKNIRLKKSLKKGSYYLALVLSDATSAIEINTFNNLQVSKKKIKLQ